MAEQNEQTVAMEGRLDEINDTAGYFPTYKVGQLVAKALRTGYGDRYENIAAKLDQPGRDKAKDK